MTDHPFSLRDMRPAMLLAALGLPALAAASLWPGVPGQYVVFGPPWAGRGEVLRIVGESGGALIELGGVGNLIIAGSASPSFPEAARKAGAWLVLPAPRPAGCFTSEETK
ncbi:hypothetical protein [Haematobacter sp. UBA3484]|uniref:hypothetical protein n=2 Tax=unclassified Haematobacter TaxID=2640585 RepID=UPI0025C2BD4D|nr:hypothetical protein [Haematobacter sp. UBA3484]